MYPADLSTAGATAWRTRVALLISAAVAMIPQFLSAQALDASRGVTAINGIGASVTTYIDPLITLMYVLGTVVLIIGIIRVGMKMNSGDSQVGSAIAGWGGAALFLLIAPTFIRSAILPTAG